MSKFYKTLIKSSSLNIEICPECKGKGYIYEDELVNYHKRDYITHEYACDFCETKGRVKITTTIEYSKI